MLNISSRKTFMRTINKIGEVGKKSERHCICLSFCIWFGFSYFCWFLRRLFEHVTAKQGFMVIKLCFYQKTEVANQDFVVPVTAGVPVWCGEVCCGVVSGDDKPMCPGLCACMCWRPVKGQRPRAGSVLGGWMGWEFKKKNTQLVEHVCQINETNTNKTSRHLIQPRSVCVSLSEKLYFCLVAQIFSYFIFLAQMSATHQRWVHTQ